MVGRYDDIAKYYNFLDFPFEIGIYRRLRQKYLSRITNSTIIEMGIGTGKNLKYYDRSNRIFGIDTYKSMLSQIKNTTSNVKLFHSTNENLTDIITQVPNNVDFIVATFVLCTNQIPTKLIQQIEKLSSENTCLIIFEYQYSRKIPNLLYRVFNPITKQLFGVNFFRKPTINYLRENWKIKKSENLFFDLISVYVLSRSV